MIILDQSEITILLFDKEEGEHVRGLGLADISFFEILCNELLQSDIFGRGQGVDLTIHCIRGIRLQVNCMVPIARFRELTRSFFAEDLRMFVIMGWDNLVPGANSLVGGLFCKLLCYGGFSGTCGVDFHDAKIQLFSDFEKGSILERSPHSGNPYRAHWFPRCQSFGADDDGGRECTRRPIGVGVCYREPQVTKNKVIWSHIGDIEAEEVGSFSGDDFEFSKMSQTPFCVRGSVGVL